MKVRVVGKMDLPANRRAAALAELPNHIQLTQAEPGCLLFNVSVGDEQLRVDEVFADQAAFEAHQSRIIGTKWAAVTIGLRREYKVSELPK